MATILESTPRNEVLAFGGGPKPMQVFMEQVQQIFDVELEDYGTPVNGWRRVRAHVPDLKKREQLLQWADGFWSAVAARARFH